ncbi:MAG TPA: hypothetical protein VGF23_07240 [Gaiellaceae bacterium]
MSRAAALAIGVCLLAAGCGGREAAGPSPPELPRPLAQQLAGASDSVAAALAAGDGCTALRRATSLQRSVIAAINAHRVPPVFQEPLLGAVNALAERVHCQPKPPPPAAPVADQGDDDQGDHGRRDRGRHRGHGRHGHEDD